ncbi:MAG: Rieske (2Fe-2S) protein [Aquiluna sp.]
MTIPRRTVLAGSLAATSSIALAACAAESPVAQTSPPSATIDQAPTEISGEILLGTVDEIPVGTGKKVMVDESLTILVTHPKQDQFRAFSATCTHSGCIVSGVQDGQIACGCHGARFNTDSGEPEQGPARSPLGKITVEVRGNELYALL